MEAEFRVTRFGDRGRSHEPRNVGDDQRLEKARKQLLPQRFQKEFSPTDTFFLAPSHQFWNSALQNGNKFALFPATKFVMICYSSNRKLIQWPWVNGLKSLGLCFLICGMGMVLPPQGADVTFTQGSAARWLRLV